MPVGKTRKERNNGARDRREQNKLAASAYHRGGDRPTHFNGKKQFQRLVTTKGGNLEKRDRVGKHRV